MTEHQEEIFALFSNDLLEAEKVRLENRIQELEDRHGLIVNELGRRALTYETES